MKLAFLRRAVPCMAVSRSMKGSTASRAAYVRRLQDCLDAVRGQPVRSRGRCGGWPKSFGLSADVRRACSSVQPSPPEWRLFPSLNRIGRCSYKRHLAETATAETPALDATK